MPTEDLKAKVSRYVEEGWNKGNLTAFDEVCAANLVIHHPMNPHMDLQALKETCGANRAAFPDMHMTLDDVIVGEGGKVAWRWAAEGTNTGGPAPTGKRVHLTGILMARFAGGKMVEAWEEFDVLSFQKQLGG